MVGVTGQHIAAQFALLADQSGLLWCPATDQKAKKLAPGNFFLTLFALLGFKSLLFYTKQKKDAFRYPFFVSERWERTIGSAVI